MSRLRAFFTTALAAALLAPFLLPCPAAKAEAPELCYLPYNDYFRLFDDNLTHKLTVYISRAEWDGLIQDMKNYGETDERMRTGAFFRADLVYEDELGSMAIKDVGFRTRGNTTRSIPEDEEGYQRAHFALKFDETFGLKPGTPEYKALKSREFCELEGLDLKWNLWTDKSHIRELYCYDCLNAAGITAPEVSLAALKIVIGGEEVKYGVYTIVEPIDKTFLTKRCGKRGNDGNLYKCLWENTCATLQSGYPADAIGIKDWQANYRPAYDLKTNKDAPDTYDIKAFIKSINTLTGEDFKSYIEKNFKVDCFLRLLAMNALLGACDDYRTMGNNYYLYFSNIGRAEMLPYDYDACLGGGWAGEPHWSVKGIAAADIYEWFDLSEAFLGDEVSRPLLDKILAIEEYAERYEYYLGAFIDEGIFSYEKFEAKFKALKELYEPYVSSDTDDHGEQMELTNEQWYFKTKIATVKKQL